MQHNPDDTAPLSTPERVAELAQDDADTLAAMQRPRDPLVLCPLCKSAIEWCDTTDDYACPKCGLAGPRDVLDEIARLNHESLQFRNWAATLAEWFGTWKPTTDEGKRAQDAFESLTAEFGPQGDGSIDWKAMHDALKTQADRAIARLKTPEYVMGECERIMRRAGIKQVDLDGPPNDFRDFTTVYMRAFNNPETLETHEYEEADTLAEAFAKLKGVTRG